jgi:hypothetical protein
MSEVLDIPLSITEQMDSEVLYWDPGVTYPGHMVPAHNKGTLGVLATELDCLILREYASFDQTMEIIRPIRSYSFIEVNEKAREIGCTQVDVIGRMNVDIAGEIVDSWTVPCE